MTTRLLVQDYIKYRLAQRDLDWDGAPDLPDPEAAQLTMRALGTEFEHRYNQVFQEMSHQIHVTPNTAQSTFTAIVHELFSDGIKWGRVVALFSFGGNLAVYVIEKEMPLLVNQIVDWVTMYVDTNLASWITQHGGWDGFVEFYQQSPERRNESPWPSLKTMCGYGLAAVGVLTLGAILAQRS